MKIGTIRRKEGEYGEFFAGWGWRQRTIDVVKDILENKEFVLDSNMKKRVKGTILQSDYNGEDWNILLGGMPQGDEKYSAEDILNKL
ncbi:MAG: hypothetical protein F4X82_01870 [Candidatus Spechtbacteria bacterium SB0662_bin_43]|uniref:Uncharacterized protein n=1 Tax=Candidatus Spechtbacteria bacterium SB0662_bin_43 TaxID=2604897 RepID=A0A845D949_9BACT|nr:hypothetical protein [Candidatus Spechtbacteria bacterium SB0662_bin_43]